MASEYSPWTANTANECYITAQGGHRIGVCGVVSGHTGATQGLRELTSISIRVARDMSVFKGETHIHESILIIGRPGAGKTTMLRDLVRYRSNTYGESISVVDERSEIFPLAKGEFCFPPGKRVDVLTGRSKKEGILQLLRTMTPDTIAVDEVTAPEDCDAILNAAWCGVHLIASAHADSLVGFKSRNVYKPLVESGIFKRAIVLRQDRSWCWENL
jgi:stage III sporulation protein AA